MPYTINGASFGIAEPVSHSDITFVPVADVAEALGGSAEWKHEAKAARVEVNGKVAFVYLDNPNAVVDGAGVDMAGSPYLEGDRLWAPVRLFRDGFGASLSVSGSDVSIDL